MTTFDPAWMRRHHDGPYDSEWLCVPLADADAALAAEKQRVARLRKYAAHLSPQCTWNPCVCGLAAILADTADDGGAA